MSVKVISHPGCLTLSFVGVHFTLLLSPPFLVLVIVETGSYNILPEFMFVRFWRAI